MKKNQNNFFKSKIFNDIAPYLNLGWQLVSTILIMVLIGWGLDLWLKTKPLFIIIFSILGCILGMYDFIRNALKKK
ncbi:MAG: AtpZ/AtpI family protein [Candidatus Kapaibacteriales bacterium]